MGKSSDTPKEVKNARREETHRVREARRYGAGCIYMHRLTRTYMESNEMRCDYCGEAHKLCDLDFNDFNGIACIKCL